MSEKPNFETEEKNITSDDHFKWGFYSGVRLFILKPVSPISPKESGQTALDKLVHMSRSFPQMGVGDPAGIIEQSMTTRASKKANETKAEIIQSNTK